MKDKKFRKMVRQELSKKWKKEFGKSGLLERLKIAFAIIFKRW